MSAALRARLGLNFTFLSDGQGTLLDELGIRHHAGRADGDDISYPASVLVDAQGIIRWTYQSDTYRQRARPEDIFKAIDGLAKNPESDTQ